MTKAKKNPLPWWSEARRPKHELSGVQEKAVAMLQAANYRITFGWLCTKDDVRREFSCAQREMARRLMMKSTRLTNRAKYTSALVWVQEALEEISVYRVRKGKAVRIPDHWVGKVPHERTKAKRKEFSKLKRKARRRTLRKEKVQAFKEQGPTRHSYGKTGIGGFGH